jgi:hypothetical protein
MMFGARRARAANKLQICKKLCRKTDGLRYRTQAQMLLLSAKKG